MRTLVIVLFTVVLLALAAVVIAPASLLAPYVERATHGRVTTTGVDGTIWRGRVTVNAGTVGIPVAWELERLPLLSGEARVRVTPGDANATSPRASVSAERQRIAITDLAVTLPASAVTQALLRNAPIKAGFVADGEITAATPRLDWTPTAYAGGLDVVWRNARLVLVSATPVDLGELTVRLAAAGDRLAGPVANRGGDIDVRGDIALGSAGSALVSLVLTPRRADDTELARALALIGTPEGAGWRISWQTNPP